MSAADESEAVGKAPKGAADGRQRSGRQVSVDWCEVSAKVLTLGNLLELCAKHLGPQFGREGLTVLRDDHDRFHAIGPLAMRVTVDRVGQANRHGVREPWVGLRLPGELCQAVGTDNVLDLVEMMGPVGKVKVSRLDLALDDFDKTFSPRMFARACVDGALDDEHARIGPGAVTRVARGSWEWSRRKGGCFWLGGRKSARLLRVYDKDRESDGRVPSTRIELQSRDEFATELMRRLLEARWENRALAEVWAEHVVAFVDLREAHGSRSGSQKWRRVPWWEKVVGDVSGVATAVVDDSTVGQWWRAMQKQCEGFIGVALRAQGVTGERFRLAATDPEVAQCVVRAVQSMVGKGLKELSPEHGLRLGQLTRARERGEAFVRRVTGGF